MASIGDILLSTGAATLQTTPKTLPRRKANHSSPSEKHLGDKRRPRAQTGIDARVLEKVLEVKGKHAQPAQTYHMTHL